MSLSPDNAKTIISKQLYDLKAKLWQRIEPLCYNDDSLLLAEVEKIKQEYIDDQAALAILNEILVTEQLLIQKVHTDDKQEIEKKTLHDESSPQSIATHLVFQRFLENIKKEDKKDKIVNFYIEDIPNYKLCEPFRVDQIKQLVDAFCENGHITTLKLSNTILNCFDRKGLTFLLSCLNVRYSSNLKLSLFYWEAKVKALYLTAVVEAFQGLQTSAITQIDIIGIKTNISFEYLSALFGDLSKTCLKSLRIGGMDICQTINADQLYTVVSALQGSSLTELILQSINLELLGELGLKKLDKALQGTSIVRLGLAFNKLGLLPATALGEFLSGLKSTDIVDIDLHGNDLNESLKENSTAFLNAINNSKINSLRLSANRLGKLGNIWMVNFLTSLNSTLNTLNLSANDLGKSLSAEELKQLMIYLQNTQVTDLDLTANDLSDCTGSAKALVDGMAQNIKLTFLEVRYGNYTIDDAFINQHSKYPRLDSKYQEFTQNKAMLVQMNQKKEENRKFRRELIFSSLKDFIEPAVLHPIIYEYEGCDANNPHSAVVK